MKTIKLSSFALIMAVSVGFLASCSDDDPAPTPLPPIGGYNSADEVGAADLVAYWPLNGNGKEAKSGVEASSNVGTSWVTGAKGQAANFNLGYLSYPVIPTITAIKGSITVSLWAKVSNNGTNPTMIFSMTRPTSPTENDWVGNINVLAETGRGNRPVTADTLMVKGIFSILKPDGTSFGGDAVNAEALNDDDIAKGGIVVVNKTAGQWMQVVYTYDGTTAINKIYINGSKTSNPQWEERNKVNNVNVGVPFNFNASSHPVIGTFGTVLTSNADGWQKSMIGEVDEIRIWKKVLNAADINSLFELEKAGR